MGNVPDPVLAVAHDALDSQNALQLWSVFSKSKNSLQDGQRLENISWRLAFRDLRRQLPPGPWPPTPGSVCSDDTKCISTTTCTPFFNIAPRKPMTAPARPAGRIIRDMIPPGLTQKLTQFQKETKKNEAYPTPASSSSSDSSGSASSSAVCIAVEPPAVQAEVEVPRVVVLTPTPNLTPHPTPPTTPLLAASAPPAPRTLAPPTPASPESTRRDPPGPLHLPRSLTRGMGSPIFPPADSAYAPASQVSYAPQSTHILPLGGHDLSVSSSGNGHIAGPKTNGRGAGSKFYLAAHAGASGSSSRSSGSNDGDGPRSRSSASSSSSDSSRERSEAQSLFVHSPERGLANARGRGRGQIRNGGRRSSSEEDVEQAQAPPQPQPQQQKSSPEKLDQSSQPQAPQPPHTKPLQQPLQPQQKPPRAASAPFLGGIGLGLGVSSTLFRWMRRC
ncbi:hypothetical protein B0H14DRAFT_1534112 [Mycena olivaceomarginata]|nr:hypothetical protein B0H14DRAFT_1534112 [Mycena olivaceomarginata]